MKYYLFHSGRGLLITRDLGYTARIDEAAGFDSLAGARAFLVQHFPGYENRIRIQGNEVRYLSHFFPGQYLVRSVTLDQAQIIEAMAA